MNLSGRIQRFDGRPSFIGRISTEPDLPLALRESEILLMDGGRETASPGFQAVVAFEGTSGLRDVLLLPADLKYLQEGDIVKIDPGAGSIRVVYRRGSPHNVLFMTERCNSRCLMCSQPPRESEDGWLVEEVLEAIPLMSAETAELCITGGEPTLTGVGFFEVVSAVKLFLPQTGLHILSNGRAFENLETAERLAGIEHSNLMVGVPLYADVASRHDFVVQAKGAFSQTIRGMINLARCDVPVECRFVIHLQTVERMVQTARFIGRNLPFVSHVALMGLEMTGYTRSNLEALWIDPYEYRSALEEAVFELQASGVKVMIYNLPLCLVPESLWPVTVQSISDWKNIYMPECSGCEARGSCAGFFASATLRYSSRVRPLHGYRRSDFAGGVMEGPIAPAPSGQPSP
jgi:His-Xaa-Ser system radical SAM maturase HxsC